MRHFTFGPPLSISGRKWKGPRGWAGKPFHPPLTDVPVTAYMFVAAFDVLSIAVHGSHARLGTEFYRAGTWTLIGGAGVSTLTALTGFWDWWRSSKAGTQARRTINAHAITMIVVTLLVVLDLILRVSTYMDNGSSPAVIVALSVVAAILTFVGSTIGGSLVYDYGFNIETSGDHPVWHESEVDVWPGQKAQAAAEG